MSVLRSRCSAQLTPEEADKVIGSNDPTGYTYAVLYDENFQGEWQVPNLCLKSLEREVINAKAGWWERWFGRSSRTENSSKRQNIVTNRRITLSDESADEGDSSDEIVKVKRQNLQNAMTYARRTAHSTFMDVYKACYAVILFLLLPLWFVKEVFLSFWRIIVHVITTITTTTKTAFTEVKEVKEDVDDTIEMSSIQEPVCRRTRAGSRGLHETKTVTITERVFEEPLKTTVEEEVAEVARLAPTFATPFSKNKKSTLLTEGTTTTTVTETETTTTENLTTPQSGIFSKFFGSAARTDEVNTLSTTSSECSQGFIRGLLSRRRPTSTDADISQTLVESTPVPIDGSPILAGNLLETAKRGATALRARVGRLSVARNAAKFEAEPMFVKKTVNFDEAYEKPQMTEEIVLDDLPEDEGTGVFGFFGWVLARLTSCFCWLLLPLLIGLLVGLCANVARMEKAVIVNQTCCNATPVVATSIDPLIFQAMVKDEIAKALEIYDADKIGSIDYAQESIGGQIISTRCSKAYNPSTKLLKIFNFPLFYQTNGPRIIIQRSSATVYPGEAYSFEGKTGYVVIKLAMPIKVTRIIYEHLSHLLAPGGDRASAPKILEFKGYTSLDEHDWIDLGTMNYDLNKPAIQYIDVESEENIEGIEVIVRDNYGKEYTSLYRIRVLGVPVLE